MSLFGPFSAMPTPLSHVSYRGEQRTTRGPGAKTIHDPMYGPAARCKSLRQDSGERSCIDVSGLRLECVVLRAIMDISARAISLADRPRPGHLGHQCSHAPGRPNLHLFSSSRRPRRGSRVGLTTSSRAPRFAPSCDRRHRMGIRQIG
jgi:hypothetical protein